LIGQSDGRRTAFDDRTERTVGKDIANFCHFEAFWADPVWRADFDDLARSWDRRRAVELEILDISAGEYSQKGGHGSTPE